MAKVTIDKIVKVLEENFYNCEVLDRVSYNGRTLENVLSVDHVYLNIYDGDIWFYEKDETKGYTSVALICNYESYKNFASLMVAIVSRLFLCGVVA